jgi:hypothetical protein
MRYAESVVPLESWYKSERRWAWRKSWARKERTSFSPVYVCNTELASSTRPRNKATVRTRKAARMSTPRSERATTVGSSASRKPGSGREPIALSTAILSGSGMSSVRRLNTKLSSKSPPMWGQYGRTWRSSRRRRVRMPCVFAIVTLLPYLVVDVRQGRRTHMLQTSSKTGRTRPRAIPTDGGTNGRVGHASCAIVRGPRDAHPERTRTAVCDVPRYPPEPSFGSSVNARCS